MQIANPMYDVIFKQLMEKEEIAKFFISTILDLPVLSLEVRSREFTYEAEDETIKIFRLDFLALIKLAEGPKKVLIEVQKARKLLEADVLRFRSYLGEQYRRSDKIGDRREILGIITIYILGFNLNNIDTPYLRVRRHYEDGITGKPIQERHKFVEQVSHDSYYIQVNRISGKSGTRLERLLNIFEQRYFKESRILKDYPYPIEDDAELEKIINTLRWAGSDAEVRRQLDLEAEAWQALNEVIEESLEKDKTLQEKDKALEEKDKALEKAREEAVKAQVEAAEKDRVIAELTKRLTAK